jgi:hypothetical protein
MKAIKIPVVLSLLLTLAGGTALTVQAEDEAPAAPAKPAAPATPPAPKKPIQQTLSGKVVAIDRLNRTVTLQVNNLTYVLQITDSTRVNRSGKEQSMADFVVGEEISVNVMLRELASGRIEVAVLSVELPEVTAAQGRGNNRSNSPGFVPPPFQNGPNPGNVDGPVVSPSR